MYYMLMRVYLNNKASSCPVLVFDLWNGVIETGYEIHLTISAKKKANAFAIAKDYIACIYNINDWDKIFREIKECK